MGIVFLNHLWIRRYLMPPKEGSTLRGDLKLFQSKRFLYFTVGMDATVMLYVVYPQALWWSGPCVPVVLRWVGVVLGLGANAIWAWSHKALGRSWAPAGVKVKQENHVLVTDGPYAYTRHPMYLVMFMQTAAFFFISGSLLILIPWLHNSIALARHARTEEKALTERYGEQYIVYAERTRRFLPRIGRAHRSVRQL